jgi:hypothetical protein
MTVKTAAAVVVVVGLGGCGGSARTAGSVRASASSVQVSSTSCETSGTAAGRRIDSSSCVYVLSDGRRFRCPLAFSRSPQSVHTLEHAPACRRLSSLVIPVSRRRVFAAIEKVRSCLASRGLRVTGGPSLGAPRYSPVAPIGELVVANGNAPVLIGFYENSRAAQRFEPTAISNIRRVGGQLARRRAVIVLWTRPPAAQLRLATEACAFGDRIKG